MNKGWRQYFFRGLSLLLIAFPSGCYNLPDQVHSLSNPQAVAHDAAQQDGSAAVSGVDAGHNSKNLKISSPKNQSDSAEPGDSDAGQPEAAVSPSAPPSGSEPTANGKQGQKQEKISSTSSVQKKPSKQNYDVNEPFNASRPTLMGFKIHDKADDVLRRFGQPTDRFQMDDPSFPITVYEYPGFSIGFNPAEEIVFIEVNSDKINPGLNGLRLGDSIGKALETLGKPDSKTDYVITFQSEDITLKLDIDPASKTVSSIKLF
ncbi:hypothetical protein [Ferviditalea candida]|uniref:AMIN domain-containing protein n=1 Tax=Ferviditalea candida TaxID=3108399 RepID=A0ABU5ZCF1_9BACL|nr:hypothetical protein [Paenibacillaceae bacterium T2]